MDNMQELTLKAEQGDARAQFRLGMAYYNGDRIEKSQIKALKWWTKAAEQGVEDADYCLGCIYFDEKKFSIAYKSYLKAIKDPLINEAGFQLGVIYENGLGVGGKPEKGKEAAEASLDAIQPLFEDDTEMVFVTCGMGGGTGTGAAPVISFI